METKRKTHTSDKVIFMIFFFISITFAILTVPVIGQCECATERFLGNEDYLYTVLFFGFSFLIIQFIIYLANFITDIFKLLFKKNTDIKHFKIHSYAVLSVIPWFFLVWAFYFDGECNILTAPADSGLTIALILASIINYRKFSAYDTTK